MKEYKKELLGVTAGNFDLLHPGYINCFKDAKQYCDKFYVFLQVDPSLHRKSKYKPVIPVYDRYKALKSIRYIDEVFTYQTEDELYNLLKFWKPDIRILGEDYIGDDGKPKPFTGDDLPPKIIYTTRSHGWSTTRLKDLITKQTIKQNPDVVDKNLFDLWTKNKK
jgi:cytidyltransferase-like protein